MVSCATAEEALAGILKHQPEVVLMDIQLPGLSGIDCTAQAKKMLPAVQIIMVTVYEDTERIFAALGPGACGYLLKRCTPADSFPLSAKSGRAACRCPAKSPAKSSPLSSSRTPSSEMDGL